MKNPTLRLVRPSTDFGAVEKKPPRKRRNSEVRSREHLTEAEVERLIKAAAGNRQSHRDQTMVLVTFRHGLRTAEVIRLKWDAVNFDRSELYVARVKNGKPMTHPLTGRELRALRKLKREQDPALTFVFTSERGAPFAPRGFRQIIERLGKAAGFEFPVHDISMSLWDNSNLTRLIGLIMVNYRVYFPIMIVAILFLGCYLVSLRDLDILDFVP
jgi:type 1 fimbriae regulatory protein FimB/type 1 fimbriae regulatory protein FimE